MGLDDEAAIPVAVAHHQPPGGHIMMVLPTVHIIVSFFYDDGGTFRSRRCLFAPPSVSLPWRSPGLTSPFPLGSSIASLLTLLFFPHAHPVSLPPTQTCAWRLAAAHQWETNLAILPSVLCGSRVFHSKNNLTTILRRCSV